MLEIAVFVICRVKERVCQLFEVFQHEFANLSLPCEGRLTLFNPSEMYIVYKLLLLL